MRSRWSWQQWEDATPVLWARQGHRCAVCWKPIGDEAQRHHRQRRAIGGDSYPNLILVHPEDHQWIHEHPAEARAAGLIVSMYDDPTVMPLLTNRGWVVLTADGKQRRAAPHEVALTAPWVTDG